MPHFGEIKEGSASTATVVVDSADLTLAQRVFQPHQQTTTTQTTTTSSAQVDILATQIFGH